MAGCRLHFKPGRGSPGVRRPHEPHPADGRTIAVEAEMPSDMAALVEALRKDARENA